MKKTVLLTFILLLKVLFVFAQDTPPTHADFKRLHSPSFAHDISDSSVWIYNNATIGWTKLADSARLYKDYVPYLGAYKRVDLNTQWIKAAQFITNDTLPNPPHVEGSIFYDTTKHTVSYYNDNPNVIINLGQENVIRVYNGNSFTIPNGKIVCPDSITGITYADNRYRDKALTVAMSTHDIPAYSWGYVTTFGDVSINTSSYTKRQIFYLGQNGNITTTRPTDGQFPIIIGHADSIGVNGTILVDISPSDLTVEVTSTYGFPVDQRTNTTISFNNTTRYIKITPNLTEYHYYFDGDKYEKTVADSIQIPNVSGIYYTYFDYDTLHYLYNPSRSQLRDLITKETLITAAYWNATGGYFVYEGDKRHGITMSTETDSYFQDIDPVRYVLNSGLDITDLNLDGTGSLETDAQFGVTSGEIRNADLLKVEPSYPYTTGLHILYKTGSTIEWNLAYNPGFSVMDGPGGLLYFNEYNGTSWQLTEAASGNYVLCHVFASTDIPYGTFAIMGENEYTTAPLAEAGASSEINDILSHNLPAREMIPIATLIFQTKSNYTNSVMARIVSVNATTPYINWLQVSITGSTGSSTTSTTFLDLTDTPNLYLTYANWLTKVNSTETGIAFSPVTISDAGTVNIPSGQTYNIGGSPLSGTNIVNTPFGNISSTNVQTAINELDSEKEPLLTKGDLTESVDGMSFSATRQVIGGATDLSLDLGRVIPTATDTGYWYTAYRWGDWFTGMPSATMTFTNKSGNISQWTNDVGYLTTYTETDPIYASDSSYLKTHVRTDFDTDSTNEIQDISTNSTPGNISISKGSTLTLNVNDGDYDPTNELQDTTNIPGLLQYINNNEIDPIFTTHTVYNIADGTGLLRNNGLGVWSYDNSTYLTTETDPVWTADKPNYYTYTQVNNLPISTFTNDVGYITGYTEIDPIFTAHTTYNITNGTGFLKNDGLGNWSYDNSTFHNGNVAFSDSIGITGTHISVTYPSIMNYPKYRLEVEAYHMEYINGDTIRNYNAIMNLHKTQSGFSLDVKNPGGWLEYFAIDTLADVSLINFVEQDPKYVADSTYIWKTWNDGSGSGLDADLLDGQHGSYYQQALVSGTNIKTINLTSLLGSGDISLQTPLTADVDYLTPSTAAATYLTTETDPVFTAHTAYGLFNGTGFLKNDGAGNWYYDNSTYLTSYTETDPIFTAHTTYNISDGTGLLKNDGLGNWIYDNNTYLTGNQPITLSGDVTGSGSTAITTSIASNTIDYNKVNLALKDSIVDNDGAWDFSNNGIVYATFSTNTTVSFSNLQRKKTLWIKLTLSSAITITWPSYCDVSGDALDAAATYRIYAACWSATSGGEDVHISIRKIQ